MMKKPQLFLLHFAGGNYYSFQAWTALLREFEVIPVELPGRGRRLGEPLLKEYDQAAEDLHRQILKRLGDGIFLLYGHSMGAYLALRVAGMLEKEGKIPAGLFVSGNPGPGISRHKKRYLLDREAFMEELTTMGGIPEGFMEHKELFELYEPILRADFEIVEKNEIAIEPPIASPIIAMMGSDEELVEQISNWSRFTRSEFRYEVMEGDHFFIFKHGPGITSLIRNHYRQIAL